MILRTLLSLIIALAVPAVAGAADDSNRPSVCERLLSYEDTVREVKQHTERLLNLAVEETRELLYPTPAVIAFHKENGLELRHSEQWAIGGRSENLRNFEHHGTTVFRQYVLREYMESVLESQALLPGYLPYIRVEPGLTHSSYVDLTGVFLTLPGVGRSAVGLDHVGRSYGYVDFTLDADIPVLEIEAGNILLIPMKPRTRQWITERYQRYMAGDRSAEIMRDEAQILRLQNRGGPTQDLGRVRIHIVGYGDAR